MRPEQEVRDRLASHRSWLDEWEGKGASEEGVETGWVEALEWVLGGPGPYGEPLMASDQDLQIGSITVSRSLSADGNHDTVHLDLSEGLTVLEAVGMLMMAVDSILHPAEDDDD